MTSNPDKYLSNITNSTTNRGVEARETEIANTQLDGDESSSSAAVARTLDCPSYLQVVVEKHRHSSAPRVPQASSPAPDYARPSAYVSMNLFDNSNHLSFLNTYMLRAFQSSEAAIGALRVWWWRRQGGHVRRALARGYRAARSVLPRCRRRFTSYPHLLPKLDAGDEAEADAECVEVYRFARVGTALCVGAGVCRAQTWRRSANLRKGARTAAAELGAATRVILGAPIAGALLALRWTLQLVRDATAGTLHALSDYVLKPALALLFNAILHPLLVFVANLLQGVGVALRPACAALGECAAHVATVLRATRLVAVETHPANCHCRCAQPP